MTVLGGRKVNRTGRSTGRYKTNKHLKIGAQFVPHTLQMIESPAWQALSLSAHRVLDRIEIEHMHHGAQENGRLPVTFNNFLDYGIHLHSIAPAVRECKALGFLEVTQHGSGGNASFRMPNKFRLTYLPLLAKEPATHEWQRIQTIEQAEALARTARAHRPRPKNRIPMMVFATRQ
jgi:hypothetical protein